MPAPQPHIARHILSLRDQRVMLDAELQVRAFAATHQDLAKQLAERQDKTESLAMSHDTFSRNTRAQLKQMFDAIRELMTPPEPTKRPIGFVTPGR